MSNLLWYILLACIGIGIGIYAVYSKRKIYKVSTLIVFYLFVAGITWIGEFIVLGLFNSYYYKVGLYSSPWAQNLLGHLILNTTLYPAVAIVVVAYSLRYYWIIIFAALYLFTEYLFLKLGLYEHHWWRYYMTAIVVVAYLAISKYWFKKIIQKPTHTLRMLTLYFAAMVIIHMPAPILLLLGKQHYQSNLLSNIFKDFYLLSIVITFIDHLIISFVIVFFACKFRRWYWKTVPFIVSILSLIVYSRLNVLIADGDWNLFYYLIIQQICIAIIILIEKHTLKPAAISFVN